MGAEKDEHEQELNPGADGQLDVLKPKCEGAQHRRREEEQHQTHQPGGESEVVSG